MTRIFLSVIALALAASARADVSDSGSLTIGGQGVIQGTMTVQGSAFSVGGATFSVAGGSVTLGGRLNVAAAGIKWADGTVSVSSAGGGGTGSGAPFGPQVYTASVTIAGTTVSTGTWQIVASTNPSSAAILYFYGLSSNKWYRLSWITVQNGGSSARDYVQFNGDGGSNYKWTATGINTNGGATMLGASNADTKCLFQGSGNIADGNEKTGSFTFHAKPNDSTRVIGFHAWAGQDANPFLYNQEGGCFYDGASSLSSLAFGTAAGTMTGYVILEQFMAPVP